VRGGVGRRGPSATLNRLERESERASERAREVSKSATGRDLLHLATTDASRKLTV